MVQAGFKSIAVNTGHLVVARILAQATRVIYIVLVARVFGPELYGLLLYGQSVYMALLPLAALGMGRVLGSEIAKNRARGQVLVGQALTLRVSGALVAAALCGLLGWANDSESTTRMLLLVFAAALFGRAIAAWAEDVCVAYEAARHIARQELLFRPAELAIAVLVIILGGGVIALAAVHAAIWWLQGLRGIYIVNRRVVPVRALLSNSEAQLLLTRGVPLGISAVLTTWLFQGPIVLFRQSAHDADAVGQFALIMQALMILVAVAWSVAAAALPVLSRAAARADGMDRGFLDALGRLGWLGSVLLGLVGLAIGPWAIVHVFGSEYAYAGEMLGWALMLSGPMLVGLMTSTVLVAHGRRRATVIYALAGAASLTFLLPPMSIDNGAVGAVLACGIGMGIWAVGQSLQLWKLGVGSLSKSLLAPVGIAVASVLVYLFGSVTLDDGIALVLALLILSIGSLGCVSSSERSFIHERVSSFLPPNKRAGD